MKDVPEIAPEIRGLLEEIVAKPRSAIRLANSTTDSAICCCASPVVSASSSIACRYRSRLRKSMRA